MPPVAVENVTAVLAAGPPFDRDRTARRTEATLKEYALGEPTCGFPSRLKRMRSIALASVAVPTVERGSPPSAPGRR